MTCRLVVWGSIAAMCRRRRAGRACLIGIQRPQEGAVLIDGHSTGDVLVKAIAVHICSSGGMHAAAVDIGIIFGGDFPGLLQLAVDQHIGRNGSSLIVAALHDGGRNGLLFVVGVGDVTNCATEAVRTVEGIITPPALVAADLALYRRIVVGGIDDFAGQAVKRGQVFRAAPGVTSLAAGMVPF